MFSQIKNKLTKEATRLGRIPTTETIYALLIERSRANMHVVVCMSPIGDAFRNRLRQYPALINCTTIDWFLEWPREALLEVGNKFLMNLNLTLTITGETKPVGPWGATPPPFPPPSGRSIPFDSYFSGIERETLELLEKARGGGRRGGRTASTSSLFRGIRLFSSRRLALAPSSSVWRASFRNAIVQERFRRPGA